MRDEDMPASRILDLSCRQSWVVPVGTRRSGLGSLGAKVGMGCSQGPWRPGRRRKAHGLEAGTEEEGRASTRLRACPGGNLRELEEDSLWEAGEGSLWEAGEGNQGSPRVVGCIGVEHRGSQWEGRREVLGRHQAAVEDTGRQGRLVEDVAVEVGGSRKEPGLVGSNRTCLF